MADDARRAHVARLGRIGLVALVLLVPAIDGCGGTATLNPREDGPREDGRRAETPEASATAGDESATSPVADAQATVVQTDETHVAAATAREPSEPPPPAVGPTGSVVQPLQAQLDILERQSRELERVATAIAEIRRSAAVGADGVPPICVDHAPIEALRIEATAGHAGSSPAASAVSALERWCEPFDHWIHPDDREVSGIRGYLQDVDRILGWMHDLQGCEHTSGAERARCENAYSDVQREAAEEAGRAIVLLDEHVRELSAVRTGDARFPCTTPVLARVDAVQWQGTMARAQMAGLSRRAMAVCHRIGVADVDVRAAERRLATELDRAESTARAQRRTAIETMAAMRGYLE